MWWSHMDGWSGWAGAGWGWMAVGHLLWWALIVVGIVALLRWTLGHGPHGRPPEGPPAGPDRALEALRERFARGEIDAEEYESRRRVLGG
jgi:putative membrane protein